MNAGYDLLKRKEATPDNLQSEHRRRTLERCAVPGTYLLIEDTTDVSYSGGDKRDGLGPIGNRKSAAYQGFRLHSVLAVRVPEDGLASESARRAPLEVCGLADQHYLVRSEDRPADTKRNAGSKRKRLSEELESERWIEGIARTKKFAGVKDARIIRVADREADMYEYLLTLSTAGFDFVVRACQNRRLQDPETGERCGHLLSRAREMPSIGTFPLYLRGRAKVPARDAVLSVSALNNVLIQSPQRPGTSQGMLDPVSVSLIRIFEENPPADVKEPLEWLLLTSQPAETFEEAREAALCYSCRWIVEEFHKALKSGMNVEELQLETGERLMAACAVMSVVALRLVDLRERVRLTPEAPAESNGFEAAELQVLRMLTQKPVTNIRDALRAVAQLGGFLGRKGDGEPGMITLWRGMETLRLMTAGFLLGKSQE